MYINAKSQEIFCTHPIMNARDDKITISNQIHDPTKQCLQISDYISHWTIMKLKNLVYQWQVTGELKE